MTFIVLKTTDNSGQLKKQALTLLSVYMQAMSSVNEKDVIDVPTPLNAYLSAYYKKSFAYKTVAERMPVIVTRVIDALTKSKDGISKEYGENSQEELKSVISSMSELKYDIQTNKPMRNLISDAPDVKFYNEYLASQTSKDNELPRYFHTVWLYAECYMYRRIREAFEVTKTLQKLDPFKVQKEQAFIESVELMKKVAARFIHLLESTANPKKEDFIKLLKLNLWGNRCDLSFGTSAVAGENDDSLDVSSLEPFVLSDHSDNIWHIISNQNDQSKIVDIILDNAAYELFTDLCLADYIVSTKLAEKIRFYVKKMPWFISDTMTKDYHWLLSQLMNNADENLRKLGMKWKLYINSGVWTIEETYFWTLPVDYSQMRTVDPDLYRQLSQTKLVIFKGDLNYRKLFGEKNWDPTTSVEEGLRGFHPSKLCTLRTLKADIVCGIREEVVKKVNTTRQDWMISGEYGVIQCCDKIVPLD